MEGKNKDNIRFETVLNEYSIERFTIIGVLIGFVFPVLSWLVDLIINDLPLSPKGLFTIHVQNPMHFIIDGIPIVLGIISYFMAKKGESNRKFYISTIKSSVNTIKTNAELARKIGKGDFSVDIQNINVNDKLGKSLLLMRDNLIETSLKEKELNWIARGKEQVADVLRKHNNIDSLSYETIVTLIKYIEAVQGAFYLYNEDTYKLENIATYAYNRRKYLKQEFSIGQGIVGQAAFEKEYIYRKEIPNDYVTVSSGIVGDKKPSTILVVPLLSDRKLQGVLEFASLNEDLPLKTVNLINELSVIIAQTIFNLKVNIRTSRLLIDSQELTKKLQKNETELKEKAEEMIIAQKELQDSNKKLEIQFKEVERGRKRQYSLLENASEVITIYDDKGIVKYVSPSVKGILGYEPNEMEGQNRFDRGDSILQKAFNDILENPKHQRTFEYKYEKKNKEPVWLETTGRNLLGNHAIGGILFNTRDITVRKIAEKAQRMSGEMQALSENSPDMIARLSPEGKFFYVNPVLETITGLEKKYLNQKKLKEIKANEEIINFFEEGLNIVTTSEKKHKIETTLPTIDGKRIMQVNIIPEYNNENEMETILFVAHDITERKRIELEIEKKNKDITESINYAQRIQSTIIPDFNKILKVLPKSFIYYKPRDIVSGDIPWFYEKDNYVYIAAVDCTGHGVPGALLSFISYFTLNRIADHDEDFTAGEILDQLHIGVRKTLKQDQVDANARDGMDIAFCKINKKNNEVQYSGAHRPLYHICDGKLIQYKGNPKAIGGIPTRRKKEANFVNHIVNIKKGDKLFFFSDGMPDQIGGPKGRKYQARRIREVVMSNINFSMQEFGDFFKKDFEIWKGKQKQIDDVILIGIEF